MNLSIVGMGYVGTVSGACLAKSGHRVYGVEINPAKVDLINAGKSPIVEEGISDLIEEVVGSGRMSTTSDLEEAVVNSDVTMITVGTPSVSNGALSLTALERVAAEIGMILRSKSASHTVVIRSTVLPGTTEKVVIPALLESSGRTLGNGLEVCFNPEFLREGKSIQDFFNPPQTIVGCATNHGFEVMESIYDSIEAPIIRTSYSVAESVKFLSNIYHAVKICFANEVGSLLKDLGIDARDAMEIFCNDTDLNISSAYLRPGFAFGGSCLPKDLRAFIHLAKHRDVALPMLEHIPVSNLQHIERAYRSIVDQQGRKVALFGLAFKSGTDDLRESPIITLAERLIGRGYELKIHDPEVEVARLIGSNREFIEREIPHFADLMCADPSVALEGANIIVIAHEMRSVTDEIIATRPAIPIIDLVGVRDLQGVQGLKYLGICW
jgi:GDP-mannose 6-dehydrogenase